ncbi:chorismate synthase [Thermophilibacter provencensis]|uniref:Chorismate synthase n=1 Tax=Thermophilibacter provencensis TaxID=1852386 RepID=A0ABT7V2T3_9ACTN|nr:chorismate synthase [Thermophilibacter provencensis]MDM8270907.1 chorismate synthase [Thermophilibacter provencensis]
MPSSFGTTLRVSVFGQSHSPAVGCVVEGLPSGMRVDLEALEAFVTRRAPGNDPWGTPRKEPDHPRIVSGLNTRGETCGAPLAAIIENTNTRSQDYGNVLDVPRPGHADFTAWAKWHGAQDVPGGGHFSGRLTGPLCVAGALALQWLATRGVSVRAHVAELAGIPDEPFSALDNSPEANALLSEQMASLADGHRMPTINEAAGQRMVDTVMAARAEKDTVGGIVECACTGLPAGVGSPMFDGMENVLARALFGIPAVKGVEFGRGFDVARMRGTQNNDPFEVRDGTCVPRTNNAGGILGGITTGAPLLVRCALKPISSVMVEQDSVDLTTMEPARLKVHGRHDTTAVIRAVPVVEAVCALAVADALLTWPAE